MARYATFAEFARQRRQRRFQHVRQLDAALRMRVHGGETGVVDRALDDVLQRADTFAAAGDQRHHRRADCVAETIWVDVHAVSIGNVHHVQRDDHGDVEIEQFAG